MDRKKNQTQEQVNALVAALGGFAEMAHIFYTSMIEAGASNREATEAMKAYISAFYHEQIEDARRQKKEQQENGQET